MNVIYCFLALFCAIFGAYTLTVMIYDKMISSIMRRRSRNAGKSGRNTHDKRNG